MDYNCATVHIGIVLCCQLSNQMRRFRIYALWHSDILWTTCSLLGLALYLHLSLTVGLPFHQQLPLQHLGSLLAEFLLQPVGARSSPLARHAGEGELVGFLVGEPVGLSVGFLLGLAVGIFVGEDVGLWVTGGPVGDEVMGCKL